MWVISTSMILDFIYSKKENTSCLYSKFLVNIGVFYQSPLCFIFQAPHTIIKVKAHDSQ